MKLKQLLTSKKSEDLTGDMKEEQGRRFSLRRKKVEKADKVKPPRRKVKRKTIYIGIGVCIAAAVVFWFLRPDEQSADNLVSRVDLSELFVADIEYTVSAAGIVESKNSSRVFGSQNFRITEILVEVGDVVSKDQLLLTLDTAILEESIESMELSMAIQERNSALQLRNAQDAYRATRDAIEGDTNASLISAESSVRNAHENWQRAIRTRDTYLETRRDGHKTAVNNTKDAYERTEAALNVARSANNAARSAVRNYDLTEYQNALMLQEIRQTEYDEALAAYNQKIEDGEDATAELATLDNARTALNIAVLVTQAAYAPYQLLVNEAATIAAQLASAENAHQQAKRAYDTALEEQAAAEKNSGDRTLTEHNIAIENAHEAYQTALRSQNAAEEAAQNSLRQSRNSLSSAELAANTDMSELEYMRLLRNLENAVVTAGESGTVTAIYAAVGNMATGLLFVIEDIDDLFIETTITEFDVAVVSEGKATKIRAEAARDVIYDGAVTFIAPTSTKTSMGATDRMGDTVFATEVDVLSSGTALRIGMSVRLDFIIEQETDVLVVPYDTVYMGEDGNDYVMIVEGIDIFAASGTAFRLREIAVTTGLSNDISIVINGAGIEEGVVFVNTPGNYRHLIGREVILTDQIISRETRSMRDMWMNF
ncbi:MAG: efflux RND transporter periplasmic adaptor subunit [Lachnospiraceae bacterium]|jgi:multidrug efflux pump subunit AcrA (membrane-fusion protein)|nr:efflux RND transporter periplasmic adaptor subunit [Lachnospiraceae bacterium]